MLFQGSCRCLENVEGTLCDRCKPLYWNLAVVNPEGCKGETGESGSLLLIFMWLCSVVLICMQVCNFVSGRKPGIIPEFLCLTVFVAGFEKALRWYVCGDLWRLQGFVLLGLTFKSDKTL